jgi:bifunctional UDP-N-acetylglucosamine pyrophosphorylase / glucosamine-1-phosphate N-acetyltransferase
MSIPLNSFIARFSLILPGHLNKMPWDITNNLAEIVLKLISTCDSDYHIKEGIAIHKSAVIEQNVVFKPPVLIHENAFVGANAYIRGPVLLDSSVNIGAGCEIKQSVIFAESAIAHFNYIGNSIVGGNVNFEAGSIAANHFNERENKNISVLFGSEIIQTGVKKFGSLVGDRCKIGANAVLSPGTILTPDSIVKRLELVEQVGDVSRQP